MGKRVVVSKMQQPKREPKLPFISQQTSYNVTRITFEIERNNEWLQSVLVLSDTHIDSPKCNRDVLTDLLNQAVEVNAPIFINGDVYDLMSGPDDKRGAREILRNGLTRKTYFDDIVEDGVKFFHPYRHHLVAFGEGNHESKVKDKYGTDVIERTIAILNARGGNIHNGRTSGWLDFLFWNKGDEKNRNSAITALYHHGEGIKAISKVIAKAGEYPDADMMFYGHFHEYWHKRINRIRRTTVGQIYHDTQLLLGVPGMKDDTIDRQSVASLKKQGNASEGWSVENGHMSKPLGAWWIDFRHSRTLRRVVFGAREAVIS